MGVQRWRRDSIEVCLIEVDPMPGSSSKSKRSRKGPTLSVNP